MRASFALCFGCLLAAPSSSLAQSDVEPDVEQLRPPALIVRPTPSDPEVALTLDDLAVDVQIYPDLVVTTLELSFVNPNDRVLEGRLVVPLPANARPSRFAMDVDGSMREGVVVTREKARIVFEEIVRQGIDPGLLEWVQGSAFRARVYPVPAKGSKRIVIAYEHELGAARADGTSRVRVPLAFGGASNARYRVSAHGVSFTTQNTPFAGLEGEGLSGEVAGSQPRVALDHDLVLAVRETAASETFHASERGPDGRLYGYQRFAITGEPRPRAKPKKIALFWDASTSHTPAARARELELLRAYCVELGDVEVQLNVFSNELWSRELIAVRAGDSGALLSRIRAVRPDGGTRLGCLSLDPAFAADEALVVSDGLSTVEHGMPALGEVPVYAICGARVADHPRLASLSPFAEVIDALALDAQAGVRLLRSERPRLLGVEALEGQLTDVEPAVGAPVTGERFSLVGVTQGPAQARLRFGFPGEVTHTVELSFPGDAEAKGAGVVPRIWANARIGALLRDQDANAEQIVHVARSFSIVTPLTSMLVLETLEDYLRYEVEPPAGELHDAWVQAMDGRREVAEATRKERLERIASLWAERVAWWETEFKEPEGGWKKPEAVKKARAHAGAAGGELAEEADSLEAAPPAESPAPSADDEGYSNSESESRMESLAKKEDGKAPARPNGGIELKPWTPDRPYLEQLQAAGDEAYATYVQLRGEYGTSPAFFLDVADFFAEVRKDRALALRVLSNVAELELGSPALLRVLAHRYTQLGELELAASVFRAVLQLLPEEAQSYRDLGLVLAESGAYPEAIALLETVVTGVWDDRFPEIELIALGELNRIVAKCQRETGETHHTLPASLIKNLDVDVRVILTWDADLCDMDLWVDDPIGERANYSHTRTQIGGRFSRDFTRGYGPEEFLLKKGIKGKYTIHVHYYGTSQQTLTGATTVQVEIVRNWGRPNEVRQAVTRRLSSDAQLEIAEITID